MKFILKMGAAALLLLLWNCKQNEGYGGKAEEMAESVADTTAGAAAAPAAAGLDSARAFIRTAELKFRVKDVAKATYDIEKITQQYGGFVTRTQLNSEVDEVSLVEVSDKASVETTLYTVSNTMTLRVPNRQLDATLQAIAPQVDFLDYRHITANDVALDLMAQQLQRQRATNHHQRLNRALDQRGHKLRETTQAEAASTDQQALADQALLAQLGLRDQIKFSTIQLTMYQRQTSKRELIAHTDNIDAYQPNFAQQAWEALGSGWHMLASVLLWIIQLWGVVLLVGVVYWGVKRVK